MIRGSKDTIWPVRTLGQRAHNRRMDVEPSTMFNTRVSDGACQLSRQENVVPAVILLAVMGPAGGLWRAQA
eukprot:10787227-Alexandrium_andersonii.AAC.1